MFPIIELIASTEAINTGVIVGNNNTERIISCDFVLLDIIEKTFPIVIIPKVPSSIIGINFKRLVCWGYFGEISLNRECHETHAYSSGSGGFGLFC